MMETITPYHGAQRVGRADALVFFRMFVIVYVAHVFASPIRLCNR